MVFLPTSEQYEGRVPISFIEKEDHLSQVKKDWGPWLEKLQL